MSGVWLRGRRVEDAPSGWPAYVEGLAATYGVRMEVLVEPDANPRQAHTRIVEADPAFAIVWDHDGRGSQLEDRVALHSVVAQVERLYGSWQEVRHTADVALAKLRDAAAPDRATPRDVTEAVLQARSHPDIVILPAAHAGAKTSPFRRPLDVRRALEALVAAVEAGALTAPGGLKRALADAPFRYASRVSATAHQQFRDRYERSYDGRTVLLGPHLKLGAGSPEFCLRIYWYVDPQESKIVIGHIGEHLPDAGS